MNDIQHMFIKFDAQIKVNPKVLNIHHTWNWFTLNELILMLRESTQIVHSIALGFINEHKVCHTPLAQSNQVLLK